MLETDYAEIMSRLAKYHGAAVVKNPTDICLSFPCGNEIIAWEDSSQPYKRKIKDAEGFIAKYLAGRMHMRTTNDRPFSDEFRMFGPRMIKANSPEELMLKLYSAEA